MKLELVPTSDRLFGASTAFVTDSKSRPMRILLLQGPVGGFFRYLQRYLNKEGHSVRRLAFNGGDIAYAIGQPFEIVRKTGDSLRDQFDEIMATWAPDHVLLFGDERPIHRIARDVAKARRVPVWCFEEGYIRPNYVAFEMGGNNANSPLATSLQSSASNVTSHVASVTPVTPTLRMMLSASIYFLIYRACLPLFPLYKHHRNRTLHDEIRYWVRSAYRRLCHRNADIRLCRRLLAQSDLRFFLVALQVHDDLQLRAHGNGWRMGAFLHTVLSSFRDFAPTNVHLIVKAHPLDIGYGHHRSTLNKIAAEIGLGDRVHFLKSGPVNSLIRLSSGVITVNSTVGVAALFERIPVMAFGNAFYVQHDLARLWKHPSDLARFWTAPPRISEHAATTLRNLILRESAIPGSFYVRSTWAGICQSVLTRLTYNI